MNLNRMAELLIKLFGISFLVACIVDVTYLPHYVMQANYAHQRNLIATAADYDLQLVSMCVRGLIYLGLGMGFMAGWKRLLRLLIGEVSNPVDPTSPAG
ncbi:MAG: hypothetical protein JWL77_1823 [Chthonomonadaceae bacterium]|nr:hypothetical protein [Chthonomonadaceae bacterium]